MLRARRDSNVESPGGAWSTFVCVFVVKQRATTYCRTWFSSRVSTLPSTPSCVLTRAPPRPLCLSRSRNRVATAPSQPHLSRSSGREGSARRARCHLRPATWRRSSGAARRAALCTGRAARRCARAAAQSCAAAARKSGPSRACARAAAPTRRAAGRRGAPSWRVRRSPSRARSARARLRAPPERREGRGARAESEVGAGRTHGRVDESGGGVTGASRWGPAGRGPRPGQPARLGGRTGGRSCG